MKITRGKLRKLIQEASADYLDVGQKVWSIDQMDKKDLYNKWAYVGRHHKLKEVIDYMAEKGHMFDWTEVVDLAEESADVFDLYHFRNTVPEWIYKVAQEIMDLIHRREVPWKDIRGKVGRSVFRP